MDHTQSVMEGYDLGWTIQDGAITLQISAETTGWVGFGLAKAGGMIGADIMVASVDDESGEVTVSDLWASEEAKPHDDVVNDWTVVSGSQENGVTTVTVSRTLDTGDSQDRVLTANPRGNRIIAAYGSSDVLTYHGATNRVKTRINLFDPSRASPLDEIRAIPSIASTLYTAQNWTGQAYCTTENYNRYSLGNNVDHMSSYCPDQVTQYVDLCFTMPNQPESHIVALEYVIDERNEDIVHHFVLSGYDSLDCTGAIQETTAAWVPGVPYTILPENVGYRAGPGAFNSFKIGIHYDNPTHREFIDDSGVRLWYTTTLREHDAGTLTVGDPNVSLQQGPYAIIPSGHSRFTLGCEPSQTTELLKYGDINVFFVQLHMHMSGVAMQTRHTRDGTELRNLKDAFYDFNSQDFLEEGDFNLDTHEPAFTVKAGDALTTTCWYNNDGRAGDIATHSFGLASQDEMCMTFLGYYPKINHTKAECDIGSFERATKGSGSSEAEWLEREFGQVGSGAMGVGAGALSPLLLLGLGVSALLAMRRN